MLPGADARKPSIVVADAALAEAEELHKSTTKTSTLQRWHLAEGLRTDMSTSSKTL
jgi:hypothetical protein